MGLFALGSVSFLIGHTVWRLSGLFEVHAAVRRQAPTSEGFNDWAGRGYDDFVPGDVTKTAPSGDETT